MQFVSILLLLTPSGAADLDTAEQDSTKEHPMYRRSLWDTVGGILPSGAREFIEKNSHYLNQPVKLVTFGAINLNIPKKD